MNRAKYLNLSILEDVDLSTLEDVVQKCDPILTNVRNISNGKERNKLFFRLIRGRNLDREKVFLKQVLKECKE